jgi:hypothetical protein
MVLKLSYGMTRSDDGYLAKCRELSAEAMGRSPEKAIEALRAAVAEGLSTIEAVGPPSRPPSPPQIELVAEVEPEAPDPQGPGDSPAAERLPSDVELGHEKIDGDRRR